MNSSAQSAPWEKLLDGRFDSQRPGCTLWGLFADQRGRVAAAVTLFIIKQSPGSLLPLAVGMIIDVHLSLRGNRPIELRTLPLFSVCASGASHFLEIQFFPGHAVYTRGVTGQGAQPVVAPALQVRELARDLPSTAEQPATPPPWQQLELPFD